MTQAVKAAEARLERFKAQSVRLREQQRDVNLSAGKTMLTLRGHGVTKKRISEIWRTSRAQVDEMIARAEHQS